MKILFLSRWSPYPADNGAKIRILNVIRALARRHDISLLTFEEAAEDGAGAASQDSSHALGAYCSRVQVFPYAGFQPGSFRAVRGFISNKPRSLVDTYSPAMADAAQIEVDRQRPDVVVASQIDMLPYALSLGHVPAVLEELELSLYRDAVQHARTLGEALRSRMTWLKLSAYLRSSLPRFAACTVVSERERSNVRLVAPAYTDVLVAPNAVDVASYAGDFGPVEPDSLIFSGAITYHANADAVQHLVADIFPLIRRARPNARLRVTGRTNGLETTLVSTTEGVQFTGYIDDLPPVVAQSSVCVVPLRRGGGTRLKILEAMAIGTPVVSTRKGAEGLDVTDGENILLADDAGEFANKVVRLLESPEARARIALNAKRLVQDRYDWACLGDYLCGIVEDAARVGTAA